MRQSIDILKLPHLILLTVLSYLESWFGLSGTVLEWFVSYVTNRGQAIKISATLFEFRSIYGVPQGSVLGLLLLSLYTIPLSKTIGLHPDIKFQFYMDVIQLYVHVSHKNASAALLPS